MSDIEINEIEEMNKVLSDLPSSEVIDEQPEEKEESVEKVEVETKEEDKAEPAPEKTDEVVEEVKTEAEEPKPEPDEKDKEIDSLRQKLAEAEAKPKDEPKLEPKEPEIADQDFLGTEDLDDLTRDPKKLNEVFNKIYKQARTDSERELIKQLPSIITTHVETINTLKETSENFFKENEDLKPFRKVVQVVFGEVASATPNKPLSELLKEVESDVRKRLDLPKVAKAEKAADKDEPPKLPKKGGSTGQRYQSKPQLSSEESEIEAMNKVLNS